MQNTLRKIKTGFTLWLNWAKEKKHHSRGIVHIIIILISFLLIMVAIGLFSPKKVTAPEQDTSIYNSN